MKKAEMKEQIAALQAQVERLQCGIRGSEAVIDTLNKQVNYYKYPTPSLAMRQLIDTFRHDRWSGFDELSKRILQATADAKFTSSDARRMTLASPEFQEWIIKSYIGGDK